MRMPQTSQGLGEGTNPNPLSTGKSDTGWRRVETSEDGIGPGKGDVLPKTISRLPQPRILTQPKKGANSSPINLKRKGIGTQLYPENANPPMYVGLNQPRSQGVGQYYYAPNEGNLTKNIAGGFGLLLGVGVDRSGGESAILDGDFGSKEQWSDSDLNVELGRDGYPRYDSDSNLARRPKTWRFRTKDKDVSMFPQKNQTSSPEAPSRFDIGNESLFYPLMGGVLGRGKGSKAKRAAKRAAEKEAPKKDAKAPDQSAPSEDDIQRLTELLISKIPKAQLVKLGQQWLTMDVRQQEEYIQSLSDSFADAIQKEAPTTSTSDLMQAFEEAVGVPSKARKAPARAPKIPTDLLPQERLFRNIREWDGEYASYTGDDLNSDITEILDKQPVGQGKYFQWEYLADPESDGQYSTLTVVRQPAWKEFQKAA